MSDDMNVPSDIPNADGSEYRDPELAQLFSAETAPAHSASFWSDLSTQMRAETNGGPVATLLDGDPANDPADDPTLIDLGQQRIERRHRRSVGLMLAAAAALVVAAIGLFAALSNSGSTGLSTDPAEDGDQTEGLQTESTEQEGKVSDGQDAEEKSADERNSVEQSAVTFPVVDYSKPVEVINLGSGEAHGTTPDGKTILVVDEYLEKPGSGCEGTPLLMLYGQDIATGERRPLLPDGMTVETGGLTLLFAYSDQPLANNPTPVYWTDFCDGVPNDLWLAGMATDGVITEPLALEIGSPEDPFVNPEISAGTRGITSAGDTVSFVNQVLAVISGDPNSNEPWVYGEMPLSVNFGFTPAGEVLVVNDGERTVFWRFRTDERPFALTGEVTSYQFGQAGEYLFLNYLFPEPNFAVLNFGAESDPVFQTSNEVGGPTCSGNADIGELQTPDRLPPALADVLVAIDEAAASCDWAALGAITGDSFQFGFGGGTLANDYPVAEANGSSPTLELRQLLRTPVAKTGEGDEVRYEWPAVSTKPCEDHTDEDRASLETLGYDDQQLATDCEIFGSYGGLRAGFSEAGDWQYLVSGD